MKIAIQGHPTRGHEIIQILESLGGKNDCPLTGTDKDFYYYIYNDSRKGIRCHYCNYVSECEKYTLEEFEKEFPFKVGDIVTIIMTNTPHKIVALEYYMGRLSYKLDNGLNYNSKVLTLYKEMKEERIITLTLDKAQEWYKKGGELREIALQAFSERELNSFPKSWEEYCRKHKSICLSTRYADNILLKYDALLKLEQLRDCWWNGWEPKWNNCEKYVIKWDNDDLIVFTARNVRAFLVFPTREMAYEFLKCFRDLIEKAGNLI
jgi:hypothetical protein